jgi:hypothetical protein
MDGTLKPVTERLSTEMSFNQDMTNNLLLIRPPPISPIIIRQVGGIDHRFKVSRCLYLQATLQTHFSGLKKLKSVVTHHRRAVSTVTPFLYDWSKDSN